VVPAAEQLAMVELAGCRMDRMGQLAMPELAMKALGSYLNPRKYQRLQGPIMLGLAAWEPRLGVQQQLAPNS